MSNGAVKATDTQNEKNIPPFSKLNNFSSFQHSWKILPQHFPRFDNFEDHQMKMYENYCEAEKIKLNITHTEGFSHIILLQKLQIFLSLATSSTILKFQLQLIKR